jgi:hypothetical protein
MADEIELTGDLRIQYSAAYRYTDAIINNVSEKSFFTDNRYLRYKELFLGAVVAQMVSEHTGEYYYVTSPDKDPPDFMLRLLRKHEGNSEKTDEQGFNFEVTDYTEHDKSISDVIDKKLTKGYPDNYSLVVLFRHPTETTFNYQELVNKYKDNKHWIVILMRTNQSKSGIKLPEWHWCVVAVSNPIVQKLIKLDRVDKADIPQMWYQKGRGRDIPPNAKPVKIKLPT